MVGAVSQREARIWLRADPVESARVHVFDEAGHEVPGSPFAAPAAAGASKVATVVVTVPAPLARYTYDVRDEAGASVVPRWLRDQSFRTAPERGSRIAFRFGLVSCNDMRPVTQRGRADPERPWRTLYRKAEESGLAFLLCVGDQMYADDAWQKQVKRGVKLFPPLLQRAYYDAYQAQWDFEWFRKTLARLPAYMTWDDHEIRNGWGSEQADGSAKRREAFALVREIYRRFQHDHNPPSFGDHPDDLFYAFEYGDVGFLVLDGRGERDCTGTTDPLLGTRQWKRVTEWLRDETPRLEALFVVTSVPLVHVPARLAKGPDAVISDFRDQWTSETNAPELERLVVELFDRANEHDIPVVLLGGDVHLGTIARLRSSRPSHAKRPAIYQLCSSPITNRPVNLVGWAIDKISRHDFPAANGITGRILERPFSERNFGLVDLVYGPDRYLITLRLFDEQGDELASRQLG
jgi:phosphodiesterase/alkaline phosphatase D-like protein